MKIIIVFALIFALAFSATAVITQAQLDTIYDDCFDYNNHPFNQWQNENGDYEDTYKKAKLRRQLQDSDYEGGYDDYDYEDYLVKYECDEACEQDLDDYIQDVKDINDDEAVRPCDEWWEYELSVAYDANDIDTTLIFKYNECLLQLYYMNFEYDQGAILECTAYTIEELLWENNIYYQEDYLILAVADINDCEDQCVVDVDCGTDCETFIDDNFDNTIEICVEAENTRQQNIDMGIIQDNGDRTEDGSWIYQQCIYEQLWNVSEFEEAGWEIDWDLLYESQTYENDYTLDYSVLKNLTTDQQAVLTLECQSQCYAYYNIIDEQDYVDDFYDNEHVIIALYGENFYDEYYENYYEDFGEEDEYWGDEGFYDDLDCYGEDCFDENGQFIGNGNNNNENPCDSDYCFIEFYECIDKCTTKNCPKDTCYDKTKGQSLGSYIEKICTSFNKLKEQYQAEEIIQNLAIVPPKYYDTYGKCIAKLQDAEDKNQDREASEKQYISEYYTCLTSCTEEEVILQESGGKKDDGEGQSRLIFILGSLILSAFLLI